MLLTPVDNQYPRMHVLELHVIGKGTTKYTRDFIEAWNTNFTELQSSTRLLAATKASAFPNQLNNVNTIAVVHNHPPPLSPMFMLT